MQYTEEFHGSYIWGTIKKSFPLGNKFYFHVYMFTCNLLKVDEFTKLIGKCYGIFTRTQCSSGNL